MDDFIVPLQVYLMKKEKEGDLIHLNSRATPENIARIDDICQSIDKILRSCGIPTQQDASTDDSSGAKAFIFLLLNTNFESQENLGEDSQHGYLADILPTLSPYLLLEIIFFLWYEEKIAECILHVPLDLAVDLIDVTRRFLHILDFSRSLELLSQLMLNSYKRLHLVARDGAVSTDINKSSEKLMISFQELMNAFFDETVMRLSDVTELNRSERLGIIFQKMLRITSSCLKCGRNGVEFSMERSELYKLTYGMKSCERANVHFGSQLNTFYQLFADHFLLKSPTLEIRDYINWASINDAGRSMTLQQSIGMDCNDLIEFIQNQENTELHKLISMLQMISWKGNKETPVSKLSLEGLTNDLEENRSAALKELTRRYREWDHETFKAVSKHASSMDKEDFSNLLEYLTLVMGMEAQEDHKRLVFTTLTNALMHRDVKCVYEMTLEYILRHDAQNALESPNTEECFVKFMSHNKNFKSANNMRMLLFFILKNPQKMISILVKMAIGHKDYENVMVSPDDLKLLSPIMNIRLKPTETILLSALSSISKENEEWRPNKWHDFLRIMLKEGIFQYAQLVNSVFVPFFEENSVLPRNNVMIILSSLKEILPKLTNEIHHTRLIVALGRKISILRRDKGLSRNWFNRMVNLVSRIVNSLQNKFGEQDNLEDRSEFVRNLENSLSPVDLQHFYLYIFPNSMKSKPDVREIILEYERRYSTLLARIRQTQEIDQEVDNVSLQGYFCRHLFAISTTIEYSRFALQSTCNDWEDINCTDKYAAYDQIVRWTIETCAFALEFPRSNPPDNFACLLKNLVHFTMCLMDVNIDVKSERLDETLFKHFQTLSESIEGTTYSAIYENFISEVKNRTSTDSAEKRLKKFVSLIDGFADKCLETCHEPFEGKASNRLKRYKMAHDFISEITSPDHVDENVLSLVQIHQFLCTEKTNE